MYVCIYVYMYYEDIHIKGSRPRLGISTRRLVTVYVYTYIYIYSYMYTYIYIYIYMYIYVYVYINTYVGASITTRFKQRPTPQN